MYEKNQIIGPLTSEVFSQEKIQAYAEASFDHNPIHLDRQAAQAAGFDRQIVHGMLMMGTAYQLISQAFPPGTRFNDYDIKFNQPLLVDEQITVEAKVRRIKDHELNLAITAYNTQESDKIILKGKLTAIL